MAFDVVDLTLSDGDEDVSPNILTKHIHHHQARPAKRPGLYYRLTGQPLERPTPLIKPELQKCSNAAWSKLENIANRARLENAQHTSISLPLPGFIPTAGQSPSKRHQNWNGAPNHGAQAARQADHSRRRPSAGYLTATHSAGNVLPSPHRRPSSLSAEVSDDNAEPQVIKRRRLDEGTTEHVPTITRHGAQYTAEEDRLLYELRQQGVRWSEIPQHFQGRTLASLQVRYSTKLSTKSHAAKSIETKPVTTTRRLQDVALLDESNRDSSASPAPPQVTRKLRRRATGGGTLPQNAPVSKFSPKEDEDVIESEETGQVEVGRDGLLARLCRHRELGIPTKSSMNAQHDKILTQNLCFESLGLTGYLDDTSGDIATVAWSPNDRLYAGGGVVLMDESSMQYNRPRNLLIGDANGVIRELPEHHIRRPNVGTGVNSLDSMRSTQDKRLFTTVQMVGFSPDSRHLYSVSTDGKINSYNTNCDRAEHVTFQSTFTHEGPVDLLTIGSHGLVATGCRSLKTDSIGIFRNHGDGLKLQTTLSSKSSGTQDVSYASALKWGVAPHQSRWLLAGFGQEKQRLYDEDNDLDILGESCLFDGETGQRLDFGLPRNVFDVAWNPNLGNTAFAVASVGFGKVNFGIHSVVRLMSESQAGLRCSVELECPARDINDIVYCPYDEHLVATGSTDGKIYVWDVRSTRINQDPQSIMRHGNCISVLPHDRKRWEVDTGVRFLSWGATHNRLYSGSSDGVVKVWNPYVSNEDSHIRDIATFSSAIMSGAFNSDHTELLIGEDQSRLNLLKVGSADVSSPARLSLLSAPDPDATEPKPHQALLDNKEIIYDHCGALPVRQALQGPAYNPPKALLSASEAALHRRAHSFQRGLFHQRNRHKKLRKRAAQDFGKLSPGKLSPCKLDCGFLPPRPDGDVDCAPDSRRAEDRIPDAIVREPPAGLQALLRGLVAKCIDCGKPARPPEAGEARCERCGFACFRCGERADIKPGLGTVECDECGITWAMGALGYEIISQRRGKQKRSKRRKADGKEEFGEAELAHYFDRAL